MKSLQQLIFILAFITSAVVNAQQDTLKLQREARALLRDGNKLYNKEKYSDAAIAYRKALGKDSKYEKASYNFGNTLYQEKNIKKLLSNTK